VPHSLQQKVLQKEYEPWPRRAGLQLEQLAEKSIVIAKLFFLLSHLAQADL